MKSIKKVNYPLAIPMWVILFLLVTAIALMTSACADSEIDRTNKDVSKEKEEQLVGQDQSNNLPSEVLKAVIQQTADNNEVNPKEIELTKATSETWSNGCLGLAKADEVCTQALVQGWRVKVSDGDRTWVYRTDNLGYSVRLESQSD